MHKSIDQHPQPHIILQALSNLDHFQPTVESFRIERDSCLDIHQPKYDEIYDDTYPELQENPLEV